MRVFALLIALLVLGYFASGSKPIQQVENVNIAEASEVAAPANRKVADVKPAKKQSADANGEAKEWLAAAMKEFNESCAALDSASCLKLAQAAMGEGKRDQAMLLALRLCAVNRSSAQPAQGNGDTCNWHWMFGLESYAIKRQLMKMICSYGNMYACMEAVGPGMDGKKSTAKDEEIAFNEYLRLCEKDFAPGCWNAGISGVATKASAMRKKKSINALIKSCDLDFAAGCSLLAVHYDMEKQTLKASETRAKACKLDVKQCEQDRIKN